MAKKQSDDFQNRRRFPRINLQNEVAQAKALIGADVEWLKDSKSEIFDISYRGAAVVRPKEFSGKSGDRVQMVLHLGDSQPFHVQAKVVWFNDDVVGVEFEDIDHPARMGIDEFLEDKIIGAHMISVSSEYFAEHVDFQYWYHGPKNTNVFLWGPSEKKITRAMVSFDGEAMIFEDGEFHRSGGELDWDVQASYSAENLPSEKTEDLLVILEKDAPLVERSVEILTQLKDHAKPIGKLLDNILEARS